ncbi:MAG: putative lipid II flippase FtsW [candidate division FCPU426 bacterium]
MNVRHGAGGNVDITLLAVTTVLVGFGLIMVYSASSILAMKTYGDFYYFIKRQLVWALLGFGALWVLAQYPYPRLRPWAKPVLLACGLCLLAVLFFPMGKTAGGARRWLALGPLSFQPAELLKVAIVVYLADALARKEGKLESWTEGFLPPLLVVAGFAGLLLLQPDLGTAVILLAVSLALMYAAGVRFTHLLTLLLAALPVVFYLVFQVDYRRRRLDAFFNPWQEPLGKGFQVIQSFLALGSGGLWGRGLGESQQKLFYLPAPHTDFIFSIVGEELGFVGAFGLLLLFGLLIWKCFSIARRCPDRFGKLLAGGLALLFGLQAVINMGVTAGLFPTKGTPLPLVSSGGSSLFFTLVGIGILLSVSRTLPEETG